MTGLAVFRSPLDSNKHPVVHMKPAVDAKELLIWDKLFAAVYRARLRNDWAGCVQVTRGLVQSRS